MKDAQKIALIASFLLRYPDEQWYNELPEWREDAQSVGHPQLRQGLLEFFDYVEDANKKNLKTNMFVPLILVKIQLCICRLMNYKVLGNKQKNSLNLKLSSLKTAMICQKKCRIIFQLFLNYVLLSKRKIKRNLRLL